MSLSRSFCGAPTNSSPSSLVIALGMLVGHLLPALCLSWLSVRGYRRFRDNRPDGVVLDALYWYGLIKGFGIPKLNPWIREYYP